MDKKYALNLVMDDGFHHNQTMSGPKAVDILFGAANKHAREHGGDNYRIATEMGLPNSVLYSDGEFITGFANLIEVDVRCSECEFVGIDNRDLYDHIKETSHEPQR